MPRGTWPRTAIQPASIVTSPCEDAPTSDRSTQAGGDPPVEAVRAWPTSPTCTPARRTSSPTSWTAPSSSSTSCTPDVVVCTGDLTEMGFRQEYLLAKGYLERIECPDLLVIPGNHDSRNVGYVHFEELFGPRSCAVPPARCDDRRRRLDRTRPRLRHDRPRALPLARGAVRRRRPTCASSCCTTTCCRCRARAGSATWSTTPATRSRCCSAAGQPRALGPQARAYAWRLENIFVVNAGTVLLAAPARQHEALLQHRQDRRRTSCASCASTRSTAPRRSSSSRRRRWISRSRSRVAAGAGWGADREAPWPARPTRRRASRRWSSSTASTTLRSCARPSRACASAIEPVGALFLGGEEKLRDGCSDAAALADAYGLPVTGVAVPGAGGGAREAALGAGLARALAATPVTVLVDLSDEPVLGYRERFRLISVALAWGARYVGADFEFSPQPLARLSSKPSLVVIGTGKRVGKTAVERLHGPRAGAALRRSRGGRDRGHGPRRAARAAGGARPRGARLRRAPRGLAQRPARGLRPFRGRRAGGGHDDRLPALRRWHGGRAFDSNVGEALAIAERLPARLIVLEGSGSVIPPVRAQGVLCVAGAGQATEYIAGYLGTYRMLISDVIVLTMCEPPFADPARVAALRGEIAGSTPRPRSCPRSFGRSRPRASPASAWRSSRPLRLRACRDCAPPRGRARGRRGRRLCRSGAPVGCSRRRYEGAAARPTSS